MFKHFSLILFSMFIISSCSKAIIEDTEPEPVVETVSYNSDIKPIVENFCLSCHNDVTANAGLNLSNYELVKDATKNGNLILRINSVQNPMPQTGLMPSSKRALFDKWVEDGYLENQSDE